MSEKIGKDILSVRQKASSLYSGLTQSNTIAPYRESVLKALEQANRPLNVSEIRRATGDKINWYAVKTILIDLMVNGHADCHNAYACFSNMKLRTVCRRHACIQY